MSDDEANMTATQQTAQARQKYVPVRPGDGFPGSVTTETLVEFLYTNMKPYNDTSGDIRRGIEDALDPEGPLKGFVMLALEDDRLLGALVMLSTGMKGYVPENILLFVGVDPALRGRGIGSRLIEKSVHEVSGDVKLHVEYDNPAVRLYERMGFRNKYAEMRLTK